MYTLGNCVVSVLQLKSGEKKSHLLPESVSSTSTADYNHQVEAEVGWPGQTTSKMRQVSPSLYNSFCQPIEDRVVGALLAWQMPFLCKNSAHSALVQTKPLSDTTVSGMPSVANKERSFSIMACEFAVPTM